MSYKLFLDDERFPPEPAYNWVIARSVQEAKLIYLHKGPPSFVSFDHDLGENLETGLDFAHWMVNKDLNTEGNFFPEDFDFYIHSQNPIGAENIRQYLQGYFLSKPPTKQLKI